MCHLTGSVEVMNLIMNDLSPILLFLLGSFTYFAQRNAHFVLVPILLKNLLAKLIINFYTCPSTHTLSTMHNQRCDNHGTTISELLGIYVIV